jgi:beta-phosphoglucomutase-like phosphatase (HAD superfamily)
MPAVIFDLDGTLVDIFSLHLRMFQEVLSERGLSFGADDLRLNYGKTGEEILTWFMLKKGRTVEDVHGLAIERRSRVVKALKGGNACRILPGVRRLLDGLMGAGVDMAVGSSNTPDLGGAILDSCALRGYFSAESYKTADVKGKPAPDIFLNAARKLGMKPEECVVIEDSVYGVAAAKAAGMRVIAVATGEHTRAELSRLNPDILLDSLEGLDLKAINDLLQGGI